LREATTVVMSGMDEVFNMPTTWALGYAVGLRGSTPEEKQTAFGVGASAAASPTATLRRGSHSL
jgi:hypothetical protein